jgi:hypothetical protein
VGKPFWQQKKGGSPMPSPRMRSPIPSSHLQEVHEVLVAKITLQALGSDGRRGNCWEEGPSAMSMLVSTSKCLSVMQ